MTIASNLIQQLESLPSGDVGARVSWVSVLLRLKKKVELVDQFISRVSFEDCEIELSDVYRYTFDDGSSLTLVGESPAKASAYLD